MSTFPPVSSLFFFSLKGFSIYSIWHLLLTICLQRSSSTLWLFFPFSLWWFSVNRSFSFQCSHVFYLLIWLELLTPSLIIFHCSWSIIISLYFTLKNFKVFVSHVAVRDLYFCIKWDRNHFCFIQISTVLTPFTENSFFSSDQQISIYVRIYFCPPYCFILTKLSIFVLIPHSLSYYSFIISLGIL